MRNDRAVLNITQGGKDKINDGAIAIRCNSCRLGHKLRNQKLFKQLKK